MYNQKLENIINVGLAATPEEEQKSQVISTGIIENTDRWELIIRATGNIGNLAQKYDGIIISELYANFYIVEIDRAQINEFSKEPMVEYVELPKRIYYGIADVLQESCVSSVRDTPDNEYNLTGDGVIVGIIDSGIDYMDKEFMNDKGESRILNILDLNREKNELNNDIKSEFNNDEINAFIKNNIRDAVVDVSGHGTNVAKIACGNTGVAPKSDIIAVKMAETDRGFSKTTSLMRGIDYCIKKAVEYAKPIVINISYGNNYGDHLGGTLLEQYINAVSGIWKNSICIGAGNEGVANTHIGGRLEADNEQIIEISVALRQVGLNLQIWKNYWDIFEVEIIAPDGTNLGMIKREGVVERKNTKDTLLLCLFGEPSPYNQRQEIFIDFIPKNQYIDSGIWIIRLIPVRIIQGDYNMWLPGSGVINTGTGFVDTDNDFSITVPSTVSSSISVGAYNSMTNVPAFFTGRGYIVEENRPGDNTIYVKPDIVAPGVNLRINETTRVSGTSFATPVVSGTAALLMEWGIVMGNDIYLYAEKLKANLINGARQLPTFAKRPNTSTGWGAVCVAQSLGRR